MAILAAEWMNRLGAAAISEEAMRNGLKKASWPGRFERLQSRPLVFADGAHNEEGVDTLTETIRQRFADKNVHVVFSALKDKPYQEMIKKLETEADSIHFVSFDFPRASSAEALYNASSLTDKSFDENPDSVKEWIEQKDGADDVIIITGSLYFISEMRKRLI